MADKADAENRIELPPLPAGALPVVPVRHLTLFPGTVMPITLGREISIAAAQEAVRNGHKIALLAQRDPSVEKPRVGDLYNVGTIATVIRYVTTPDGTHQLICQGEERFRLLELIREAPFLAARVEPIPQPTALGPEIEGRFAYLKERALEALGLIAAGSCRRSRESSRKSTPRERWRI